MYYFNDRGKLNRTLKTEFLLMIENFLLDSIYILHAYAGFLVIEFIGMLIFYVYVLNIFEYAF